MTYQLFAELDHKLPWHDGLALLIAIAVLIIFTNKRKP